MRVWRSILSQVFNSQERIIAYWSMCNSMPERNYSVTRKELLAIVKAVENFHNYLYGQNSLLQTDLASVIWLFNFKHSEGKIARWIQRLEEYDFKIRHCKGSLLSNADALSRRPCSKSCYCSTAEGKYEMRSFLGHIISASENPSHAKSNIQLHHNDTHGVKFESNKLKNMIWNPIIQYLESYNTRANWKDILSFCPGTKHLLDSLGFIPY